jgi:hypothetical protein
MFFKKAESTDNPKPVRPSSKADESTITRDLDKKAREDSVAPGLSVQERKEDVVRLSSADFYVKVACAMSNIKSRGRMKALLQKVSK